MKRIISILLSALMVIAIIPVSVFMVSAEDETVELYYNDFETAMNPNGGTQSSCERLDYNTTYGKAMKVWGGGRWDEPVTLNNATGAITIVMNVYTNNFVNQTTLGINGVQVVHCGGDSILKIGAVKGTANKSYRELVITVEIPDLSTGTANVTVANADDIYKNTKIVGDAKTPGTWLSEDLKDSYNKSRKAHRACQKGAEPTEEPAFPRSARACDSRTHSALRRPRCCARVFLHNRRNALLRRTLGVVFRRCDRAFACRVPVFVGAFASRPAEPRDLRLSARA